MIVAIGTLAGVALAWVVVALYAGLLSAVATMGIAGSETHAAFWRLLRALGFTSAPSAFQVLALAPTVGGAVGLVVSLWTFVAAIMVPRSPRSSGSSGSSGSSPCPSRFPEPARTP